MQAKFQAFMNQYNGQFVDFDGAYGYQCVDLAQFWSRYIGGPRFTGNAADIAGQTHGFYTWILNSPSSVPQAGDIVIWSGDINGGPGHIAIATGEGSATWFNSFDQNWDDGHGKAPHVIRHTYKYVLGWLRPPQINGEVIVIDKNDVDEVRIINSEIQGYDFAQTHNGQFDAAEMGAWTGKPWKQLIDQKWSQGEAFRAKRATAIDYYDNQRPKLEAALAEANKKLEAAQQAPVAVSDQEVLDTVKANNQLLNWLVNAFKKIFNVQ